LHQRCTEFSSFFLLAFCLFLMAKGVKSLGQHLSVHVWVTITFTSLRLSLLLFMAAVATGGETRLLDRCIDAAARSATTLKVWRRQHRSLERLPAQLADALLAARRLLSPLFLE
jgi:hypothetical protein